MTFSQTHRKCIGILAALATCFAVAAPTASAIPGGGHLNAHAIETETAPPSYEWHTPGLGALLAGSGVDSQTSVLARFDGLPAGTVAVTSALQSRPAPGDGVAAQAPQLPTMDQLEKFVFDRPLAVPSGQAYADAYESIQRYVPGGLPAQVEADNWRAVYGVPADVPEFSTDAPRTAPDALVRPTVQLPVAEPGFDWTDAGVGIAIGAIAGLILGAALLMGRRRGTLAGA
jgi:hypothetical protein